MKIPRQSKVAENSTNEELLNLCDYAMDEDVCVPVTMEDIDRLGILSWIWDPKTQSPWVEVKVLRKAIANDRA